jgi:hypothetical protein
VNQYIANAIAFAERTYGRVVAERTWRADETGAFIDLTCRADDGTYRQVGVVHTREGNCHCIFRSLRAVRTAARKPRRARRAR